MGSTAEESILEKHLRLQRENEQKRAETMPRMGVPVGGKAGEILQHLHPDEPIFVFRAQDILSVFALETYAELVEKYDGQSDNALSLSDAIHNFRAWQKANPQWVKLPD